MSEGTPQPLGTIIIREASEPANFASKRQPLGARSLCWVRGGRFVLFFFFFFDVGGFLWGWRGAGLLVLYLGGGNKKIRGQQRGDKG